MDDVVMLLSAAERGLSAELGEAKCTRGGGRPGAPLAAVRGG
jgi:hypothetical protein